MPNEPYTATRLKKGVYILRKGTRDIATVTTATTATALVTEFNSLASQASVRPASGLLLAIDTKAE